MTMNCVAYTQGYKADMSGSKQSPPFDNQRPVEIRDLSDLCTHWPRHRALLQAYLDSEPVPADTDTIIRWLVLLADRVCHLDDLSDG